MYVLIILFYAGILADGDSVAITTQEFSTKVACVEAGETTKKLVNASKKEIKFTCVSKS